MTESPIPQQNQLLAALPATEYMRIFPYLELVQMPPDKTLYESDDAQHYAYFPTTCIVSLFCLMENGASAEIAVIGNEGVVGLPLFMGGGAIPNRAVIRSAGYAYRLRGQLFLQACQRYGGRRYGALHNLLLRYTQALMIQIAQTAACNRHHRIEQQLCRWLLLSLDRLASNELAITHSSIADMLGVRREGVTEAARKLQQAGLIDYYRGHITVLDRPGLEARACECYHAVKTEFDRLLPPGKPLISAHYYAGNNNNNNNNRMTAMGKAG
ncbi:MAG: Crp/Fnr family transcriptional regulator [Methylobacter sp.]